MHIDNLIYTFSQNNLTQFLRTKISTFNQDEDDLSYLFDDEVFENYESIVKIGEATIQNDDLIVIVSKTSDPLTEKSGKRNQYEIAKKILKEELKDAALFIFYDDEGNFRFSFVKANYLGKKRNFTDFKRYSYFVSPLKANKTFKKQVGECNFSSLDEIIKSFSVEPLNKLFYQEISKAFYELIGGKISIASKKYDFNALLVLPSTPLANRKIYQEFAVRLIGRTIFCWFLKNKKSEAKKPLIPENWLSSDTVDLLSNGGLDYYHDYLEKLFFLILNKKQDERKDYELPVGEESIPFLNGGLFEPHPYDFFPRDSNGIHKMSYGLKIPNKWFFKLFEVLESFNFTIDENSINDAEVSIDPEMLGTIFENLLAEIDPDTEKSARKATGSFYTPREIVDYMVEQSIIQYLKTKTSIENEIALQNLFKEGGENEFDPEKTEEILEALNTVKILDPACGSGAFPMGALHKIITILHKLDPDAIWWKEKQINSNSNAIVRKAVREKLDSANADYIRKLGIIQNSIYGVDIQPIATEIAKLRSFLSLIIDENIIDDDENRGIEPLPNLEFKFVSANTLIGLPDESVQQRKFNNFEELQLLEQLRTDYLQSSGKKKNDIKERFLKVQKKAFISQNNLFKDTNSRAYKLMSWNPFSDDASSWFDANWMFGVNEFDIVIGNPPWGAKLSAEDKGLLKNSYVNIDSSTPNSFAYFCGLGFNISNSILTYVLPDSILVKDFSKTRKYLKDNLIEISWYLNTGLPEIFKPFIFVEHDVCVIILNKKKFPSECLINKHSYNSITKKPYTDSYKCLKQDFIFEEQNYNYNLIVKNNERNLYSKLKSLPLLGNYVQIHEGIHTGNSRDILFFNNKTNEHCKPFYYGGRAGDLINSFSSEMSGWFVDYRKEIINSDLGFYASLRDERIFKFPKLYITRTGNPIKVFYDNFNYASNNFFSLQMKNYDDNNEHILKSILPIILSSFSNYFIRTFCSPRLGSTYIETKIEHLLKIPIPEKIFENIALQNEFREIVNRIILLQSSESSYENEMELLNSIIFNLYEMNEDEISLINTDITKEQYENYTIEQ